MKTIPSDTTAFRKDLRLAMDAFGSTQKDVERACGVSQAAICNFLSGRRGLSASTLLKLWPFVYGEPASEEASHGQ